MPTGFHGGIAHGSSIFGKRQSGDPAGTSGDNNDNASSGFSWQGPPATSMPPEKTEGVMEEILGLQIQGQKKNTQKGPKKIKLKKPKLFPRGNPNRPKPGKFQPAATLTSPSRFKTLWMSGHPHRRFFSAISRILLRIASSRGRFLVL
jgi:hypothetical protein